MATTGSHLEALSAFAGFISSYLALMRVVSTVTQSKASIFLFVSILGQFTRNYTQTTKQGLLTTNKG